MLRNKVAVITGGASGIGAAAARLFVREGAKAVVADRDEGAAQELARQLGVEHALGLRCDVAQEEEVEAAVKAAVRHFGRLDIMLNNAGVAGSMEHITDLDVADYDRTVQINQRGVLLGIKHAARAMIAAGTKGCIINTGSIAGYRVQIAPAGEPKYVAAGYTASKHALVGLTRLAACELAPHGIRVNAVAPGITATPLTAKHLTGRADAPMDELERMLAEQSPLKGVALTAGDVANAMLFLASDMSRCVTAQVLVVDLGATEGVSGVAPKLVA